MFDQEGLEHVESYIWIYVHAGDSNQKAVL